MKIVKIVELFANRKVLSYEVFPPKQTASLETIYKTLDELRSLNPDFIGVTYGAGGTKNGAKTVDIAGAIQNQYQTESVAHLPCVYLDKQDALHTMQQLKAQGTQNILALRGDKIEGVSPKTDFLYASELVSFIKANGDFNVIGACYPEGHKECDTIEKDIEHLKHKVDCGVDHLISQLFFDNQCYDLFLEKVRKAGVHVPIQAGIMPVTNVVQIERMTKLCGAKIPQKLIDVINRYGKDPASMKKAGIAYAIEQIRELLENGAQGIHLYTMNKPDVAREITMSIQDLLSPIQKAV